MSTTWTLNKGRYVRRLPFYEVHYNGKNRRFSGKQKAIQFAETIGRNLLQPQNNMRIDIVNTQTGESFKFQ